MGKCWNIGSHENILKQYSNLFGECITREPGVTWLVLCFQRLIIKNKGINFLYGLK